MDSQETAKKIIASSGNTFHAKVARRLQENGWHVLVSPYYMDQSHGKAREIDLIAEKSIEITDVFRQWQGDVVLRLFIECKFIASTIVFWFAEKDKSAAEKLVTRSGNFRMNNMHTKEHHYLSTCDTVAKVFSSDSKSQEQDPIYKALNQVLNAYVSMSKRPTIIPELRENSRGTRIHLNFPVVVCSEFSTLHRTDFFKASDPTEITENFQLELQYAYSDTTGAPRDDHFLIDFTTSDRLEALCSKIERDGQISAYLSSRS